MKSINPGILWANERQIFDEIYEYLLDVPSAKIKKIMKEKYGLAN